MEFDMPKFPHVTLKLTGQEGNAFMVLGLTIRALQRAGVSRADIDLFRAEATSGDYDHLLCTVMQTVEVA
jgi:hypothetical protein